MKNLFSITLLFGVLFLASCSNEPTITDSLLDGDVIFDPSINNPEGYYISAKYPSPTQEDLDKHIIIAIHGYTATTFEWKEFVDWTNSTFNDTGSYRISQVLMGAHGTTYDDFKASK